jgi:hypothetical protein
VECSGDDRSLYEYLYLAAALLLQTTAGQQPFAKAAASLLHFYMRPACRQH